MSNDYIPYIKLCVVNEHWSLNILLNHVSCLLAVYQTFKLFNNTKLGSILVFNNN